MIVSQHEDIFNVKCVCGEYYESATDFNFKVIGGIAYPQCPTCLRTEGIANIVQAECFMDDVVITKQDDKEL